MSLSQSSPTNLWSMLANVPNLTALLDTNFGILNTLLTDGVVADRVTGENITAYQPVYLKLSDNKFYRAQSGSDLSKLLVVGIAQSTVTSGNTLKATMMGKITNGSWTWVADQPIAISSTVGTLVQLANAPQVGGDIVQIIGYPLSATSMLVLPQTPLWHTHDAVVALSAGGAITVNFKAAPYQTVTLNGDATFSSSNLAAGRNVSVKILCDGSTRNLNFPSWIFVGSAAPTTIAANKTAILSVTSYSTTDGSVVAAYAVEP